MKFILFNTENKRKLVSNFFSLVVLRGFQFLIPLITLPYLVRTVGIENYGLISFALSLSLYFGAIIQFGFGVSATREIARYRHNSIELSKIYSKTILASTLLAVISAVFFSIIIYVINFEEKTDIYTYAFIFILFQSLMPTWFFQGIENMKYMTFFSLGINLVYLANLFIFVTEKEDYLLVPLLHGVSSFVAFIVALILIDKKFDVRVVKPKFEDVLTVFKDGRHAFVAQLAPNLYNNSSVFLLGLFESNLLVGLYVAATKIIDAVISVGYILSNTFLPYLSRNIKKHDLFKLLMMFVGGCGTIGTFIFSDFITQMLFKENYLEISSNVQILSFGIFLAFMFLTFNTNYLMLVGQERVAKNISLYVSIFSFFALIFSINFHGVFGAIYITLIARFIMSGLSFYAYKRDLCD
jgi:PST family polysaccharide transporter